MKKSPLLLVLGLYLFLLSLTGFKEAWHLAFMNPQNEQWIKTILHNALESPFTGLLAGIVITSMVQSSSATIALVVATVGSGVIEVSHSVFILMGANIGTTITNTIVGLGYGKDSTDFKRVLPSILVDDIFKMLNVALFFTVEVMTGFLHKLSQYSVDFFTEGSGENSFLALFPDLVDIITKPVMNYTVLPLANALASPIMSAIIVGVTFFLLLIFALNMMGRSLENLLKDKSEAFLKKALSNRSQAFGIGLVLCWLLQSSSVTTSLIIPLVSQSIVTLPSVYYYSLGAALGTTCDPGQLLSYLKFGPLGLKAGAIHIFLNLFGVLIFALVPGLKELPQFIAAFLGNTMASRKKGPVYLIGYTLTVFILFPLGAIFL